MLQGFHNLMVTPMTESGELDEASIRNLVDFQIENGVHGILALGSTGEFFTLSDEERVRVMRIVADQAAGRVPVSFGTAASGTDQAVAMSRYADEVGAASIMVPPPYYTPLFFNTADGLFTHYATIAAKVRTPIMIYDGGGGVEVPMDVLRRLAQECENVKYLKVTVPNVPKVERINQEFGDRLVPFCGNDGLTMLELAAGARGMTIGIGNVLPRQTADIWNLYTKGDVAAARRIFYTQVIPVMSVSLASTAEFIQCFKQALVWMGVIKSPAVRSPLRPLTRARMEELRAALEIVHVPLA
ncbi:MAG TPA: dihydrodipicolinate synthase family protein [Symbiobacteriaceae bacterium]|nr:dihydrodipicolinate synthase family protein [Symbiobacteriaceae bacterium]